MTHRIGALRTLARAYNPKAVGSALTKIQVTSAVGADYIANILLQQPPLRLKDPHLKQLVADPLSLLIKT
jgi:hypothetical protein